MLKKYVETHKEIIKSDKKASRKRDKELAAIEAMYNYQLQMVDKQVEDEKEKILEDIKVIIFIFFCLFIFPKNFFNSKKLISLKE